MLGDGSNLLAAGKLIKQPPSRFQVQGAVNMLQITTQGGVKLGPYRSVERAADRYIVDAGAEVAFTAIGGEGVVAQWQGPLPAAEQIVPPPPERVTMAQARKALILRGHMGAVKAAFAQMQGVERELAETEWEYQINVRRDNPLVVSLGRALGLDIDDLFRFAATLD
jgi:hypothetical protein